MRRIRKKAMGFARWLVPLRLAAAPPSRCISSLASLSSVVRRGAEHPATPGVPRQISRPADREEYGFSTRSRARRTINASGRRREGGGRGFGVGGAHDLAHYRDAARTGTEAGGEIGFIDAGERDDRPSGQPSRFGQRIEPDRRAVAGLAPVRKIGLSVT